MGRARKKPADGGGSPAVAPKAPATDAVAQGEQTDVVGEALSSPAGEAGAGAPEGVITSSGGSADVVLALLADRVLAARLATDRLTAEFLDKVEAAGPSAVEDARIAFRAFNADPDHLAIVAKVLAFLRPEASIEALEIRPALDQIEITARSKDGKPFRRGGVAWTGDFKAVSVSAELAERIRTDPNLVVKG